MAKQLIARGVNIVEDAAFIQMFRGKDASETLPTLLVHVPVTLQRNFWK